MISIHCNKKFNFYPIQDLLFFSLSPKALLSLKIVGIVLSALACLLCNLYMKTELERRLSNRKVSPLRESLISSISEQALKPIPENGHQLKECSLTTIQAFLSQDLKIEEVYIKSFPVPTALLRQLIQKKLPIEEKDLISLYTLENAEGETYQLNGFEIALLMQYSNFFYDFFKGKTNQKIRFSEFFEDFKALKILLKSLYDPKILEEKQKETFSLAKAAFKFHLNEEKINEQLEKLLVASFEQKDAHNIENLLEFLKLYAKPLTPPIQQALQTWLNASIGTPAFLLNIDLLKHYSPDRLDFSDTALSDQELAYVSGLSLSKLILSNCSQLTNQGLECLKSLVYLQKLSLRGCNKIQRLECLKDLVNLQKLNLTACNKITNQELMCLKSLKQLQKLNLSWCYQITGQGLEHLKGLTHLKKLILIGYDPITVPGLDHLKDLTRLQELNLYAYKQLTDQVLKNLISLTGLKKLDLGECNQITDQGLEYLKGFTHLQELYLNACEKITDQGLKHLTGLTHLKELNLNGCKQITDQGVEHLKGLTQMQKLNLVSCNQVSDQGLKHLKGFTRLERLSLNMCKKVTDQGLKHLKGLTHLKELQLVGCDQITDHGLTYLYSLSQLKSYF